MDLQDYIADLPVAVDGPTVRLGNNAVVHAALKDHESRLANVESRASIQWLYYGTGTPALGDFPGIKIGDRIMRVSDDQVWRVDE